jgi:hypothetical protein
LVFQTLPGGRSHVGAVLQSDIPQGFGDDSAGAGKEAFPLGRRCGDKEMGALDLYPRDRPEQTPKRMLSILARFHVMPPQHYFGNVMFRRCEVKPGVNGGIQEFIGVNPEEPVFPGFRHSHSKLHHEVPLANLAVPPRLARLVNGAPHSHAGCRMDDRVHLFGGTGRLAQSAREGGVRAIYGDQMVTEL